MSEWDDDDAAIERDARAPETSPTDVDQVKCNVPTEYWAAPRKTVTESVRPILSRYWKNQREFVPGGVGLYLWGPAGRGKTTAVVKLAMALAGLPRPFSGLEQEKGPPVFYSPVTDLRRAIYTRAEHLDFGPVEQHIRKVKYLVLDDLVQRDLSDEWFSLLRIIKGRMDTGRPTFVTSILSAKELSAAQPLIWEQLGDNFIPLEVTGPNRRQAHGERIRAVLEGKGGR